MEGVRCLPEASPLKDSASLIPGERLAGKPVYRYETLLIYITSTVW